MDGLCGGKRAWDLWLGLAGLCWRSGMLGLMGYEILCELFSGGLINQPDGIRVLHGQFGEESARQENPAALSIAEIIRLTQFYVVGVSNSKCE